MKEFSSWLAVFFFLSLFSEGLQPSSRAATFTVEIRDFVFVPSLVTAAAGDTVVWVQKDEIPHTSTSGPSGAPDGKWDSPMLNLDETFSHTFDVAGEFPYFCRPHPEMIGTIRVEEAPANPPVVNITMPENNASFAAGTSITLEATATATDATVSRVEFFNGSTSLGVVTNAPYTLTSDFSSGTHTLTARVTDSTGATAVSDAITITVNGGGTRIENPIAERIPKSDLTIELELVLDGLISPLGLVAPDDGSGRMFVYDQAGLVYSVSGGTKLEEPLLDVRDRLVALGDYDERGLLGLAAHPNFAENPLLYTYTSEPTGAMADFMSVIPEGRTNNHQSVVAEWRIDSANTNRVDLSSRREILRIDQPQGNHNGGSLHFGPDGFLYISLGDGGAADDQGIGHSEGGNGQDLTNIYGSILRIDVDGRTSANGQYAVPATNPFVEQSGLDEIYAYGFRNPYSFGFDRLTGELYVPDVGQNQVEEVNRVFLGGNYGWPIKEGSFYFDPAGTNAGFVTSVPVTDVPANLVDPIAQYDHDDGLAIVSGFVYRGSRLPNLIGRYLTGDWGTFTEPTGRLYFLEQSELKEFRIGRDDRPFGLWLKGFGQDHEGELYVFGSTDLGPNGTSGRMLKIVPPAADLEILGLARNGTNVTLSWTNGVGPFLVQSASQLENPSWQTAAGTPQFTAALPEQDGSLFFRIAEMSGSPAIPFTTHLTGAAERPNPVNTAGTGSGTLCLEGNTLSFDIRYAGLTGVARAAHIHGPARASEAADVMIDLAPFNVSEFGSNGVFSGSVTLTPEQKAWVLEGRTYVNVHTPENGGGEIRGQIAPVAMSATLSGAAERPDRVETAAHGSGTFFLAGDQLTLVVHYQGLTAAAIAAHIHGPAAAEESAGVLIDMQPLSVGALGTDGVFSGSVTLSPEHLAHVLDGRTYFNIHTSVNTGGEIRGQILPNPAAIPLSASLSGAAERPAAVETAGTGTGLLTVEGNLLRFNVAYQNLSSAAQAAHIHAPARASEAAGVAIDLAPHTGAGFDTNGTLSGTVALSDAHRALILQGRTYVNVHTPVNGGGEIRGQISPVLYRAVMLGASERPQAVQTSGKGTGHLLLVDNRLHINSTYSGLSGAASAAHIHGPASTAQAADVMVDLQPLNGGAFGSSGSFGGAVSLTPDQLAALLDELTYINVHTPANGSGEIRGQIVR